MANNGILDISLHLCAGCYLSVNITHCLQHVTCCDLCRLVRVLLEQVVSSTIERCVDPVLMEQSVSNEFR